MNIVVLVEAEDHVCCRYRIAAFRPHWEAAGHAVSIRPLGRTLADRLRAVLSVRAFDLVILQRKLLSVAETTILRRWARRLVFDFDDAIWLRDSYSGKGFDSPKRARRFAKIAGCADTLVAGNRFLAGHAAALAKSGAVVVIPTCIEPTKYPLATRTRPSGTAKLVWLGSSSTLKGIERQAALFDAIAEAVRGVRFKVVCDRFPTFARMPVDAVPWSEATEAAELADADIGVGWVPDDPWSRGKCGLKLLQYQAAGLAVIGNPVGVQADIVRQGETGLLAESTAEWVSAVAELANDPGLRARLGRAGRAQVETSYSLAAGASAWLDLFARS